MNVRSIDANSLFHVVPDALIVVDSSDEIVAVNSVGLELFGYESHELIGRSLDVLLCPEDRELHAGLAEGYHAHPTRRPLAEGSRLRAVRSDGSVVPVAISLSPIKLDSGPGVIAAIRDQADAMVADARLAEANRRRLATEISDRLARDLHDTVIQELFAIGMSLQSVLGFIDQPLALSRVSGAIDGLDSTIRTVREVIYGRRTTAEDRTPVASIVDVIARATPALGSAPRVQLDPDIDMVSPELIDQVCAVVNEGLSNVARHANAIDVDVAVITTDGRLEVTIVDDGIGLPNTLERSSGLSNLRERAVERGGGLEFTPPPGGGLRLRWWVPLG